MKNYNLIKRIGKIFWLWIGFISSSVMFMPIGSVTFSGEGLESLNRFNLEKLMYFQAFTGAWVLITICYLISNYKADKI